MTCVVGFIDKEGVYIGGDSCCLTEGDLSYNIRLDTKVFEKGEFIFGYCASFRMGQILRFKLRTPNHPKGMDDFQYMATLFIDAVRKCFVDSDYNDIAEDDGSFLVGYNGKLYAIYNDYQVGQPKESYMAMGCGEHFALGAMHATVEKEPYKKIEVALNAAAAFSMGVRPPFNYVKLLNKKTRRTTTKK